MDKTITIRLTDVEYSHCERISRGNRSFYIRELIQRDMWGDESRAVPVADFTHAVMPIARELDD